MVSTAPDVLPPSKIPVVLPCPLVGPGPPLIPAPLETPEVLPLSAVPDPFIEPAAPAAAPAWLTVPLEPASGAGDALVQAPARVLHVTSATTAKSSFRRAMDLVRLRDQRSLREVRPRAGP
jgi:hypothetical protein